MIEIFHTNEKNDELKQIDSLEKFKNESWVNVTNPTEKEIKEIEEKFNLDKNTVKQILNTEEISRVDLRDDMKLIFIDVPIVEKKARHLSLKTFALGIIIVEQKYILTMCAKELEFLNAFKSGEAKGLCTYKKYRFTLQVLSAIASEYLKGLKLLKEEIEKAEKVIGKATKNKELLRLLSIDKSLVYLTTSLKSNQAVFERIMEGNVLTSYEEDTDILEEAMIKNKQAIELSQIYRDISRGLTTSFATISSNNLNSIMKFLAGITIVLSIPTMIASFMGMNVPLGFFANNDYSFFIVLGASLFLALLLAIIFKNRDML